MAFPEIERVVYGRNTLEAVKCDIRFPPILTIEATSPVEFQERVRHAFPFYETKTSMRLPVEIPKGIAQIVEHSLSASGKKSHVFLSADRKLKLTLNKDGVSLECGQYDRWEYLQNHLSDALNSVVGVYNPAFFTHTCVRYKNSIRREQLGLNGSSWAELLNPWVCGLLAKPEAADCVNALQTKSLMRLAEEIGLLECVFALGVHQPTKQPAFIIESHSYNESQKAATHVLSCIDSLHNQAGRFFRWCITDKLHQALQPKSI